MHYPFYEEFKNKRVKKIIDIFGKEWFKNKSILELGACHGDIGVEFIKLGAKVLFTDAREENLNEIKYKTVDPDIKIINQNKNYDLKQKFDLVLHLGTLWHVENWYNDIMCALRHSNHLILETRVFPYKTNISTFINCSSGTYDGYGSRQPIFTETAVEQRLNDLGCKFTRYDDTDLNTDYDFMTNEIQIKHVYDWTEEIYENDPSKIIHHRRLWYITGQ